jgi:protease I
MERAFMERKIAVIATDGFEKSELFEPLNALKNRGFACHVIAPKSGHIKSWSEGNWSEPVTVDRTFDDVDPSEYDALFIPGGTLNCDKLRMLPAAVDFVASFFDEGKPVAAICHGPQMLIEADVVDGFKMTSYAAIKTDLMNAGANWIDKEVVVDAGLVTSRSPEDLPAFIAQTIEVFSADSEHYQHEARTF